MSKRFRIAKRISMEDIDHFEDVEVDDDFVDKDMVQIIADNEYDPMYDDCESIAVALQLAGYGKISDLEAKLAESEKRIQAYEQIVEQKDEEIGFANRDKTCIVKQLNDPSAYVSLEDYKELKQQLARTQNELSAKVDYIHELVEVKDDYKQQLAEKEGEITEQMMTFEKSCQEYYNSDEYKKDFAIAELEKVKDEIGGKIDTFIDSYGDRCIEVVDLEFFIDNQINELKEKK